MDRERAPGDHSRGLQASGVNDHHGPAPGSASILARIFHAVRSRRREEADGLGGGTSPPPYVGGYGLWAFHARYEICKLAAGHGIECVRNIGPLQRAAPRSIAFAVETMPPAQCFESPGSSRCGKS